MTHDCLHQGHVWREGERPANANDYPQCPLYMRHRNAVAAQIAVFCQHCDATAMLERRAGFSGHRKPGQPIDHTIPPAFKKVLDRAIGAKPPGPGSTGA